MTWIIPALDETARAACLARQDQLTKPARALGRLEALAAQIAAIQGRSRPRCESARVVVFAGDHGVAVRGVSAYPSAVTAQMCLNIASGGAAVNVLARQAGAEVEVVDVMVGAPLPAHPRLINRRVRDGSRDFTVEPALTADECARCLAIGRERAHAAADAGIDVLIPGEMGIANTTSAAALLRVLFELDLVVAVGTGTGIDAETWQRKCSVVDAGWHRHRHLVAAPQALLAALGGGEIAAMAGAFLGAAERRLVAIVDGVIATAAAACALRMAPEIQGFLVWGHCSGDRPHRAVLGKLGAEPLLDLGLRLGEGTGGVLALHVVRAACRTVDEMATFAEAAVSGR